MCHGRIHSGSRKFDLWSFPKSFWALHSAAGFQGLGAEWLPPKWPLSFWCSWLTPGKWSRGWLSVGAEVGSLTSFICTFSLFDCVSCWNQSCSISIFPYQFNINYSISLLININFNINYFNDGLSMSISYQLFKSFLINFNININ